MFNENDYMTLQKLSAHMPGTLLVYKANREEEIVFVSDDIKDVFECDSVEDFMKFTGGCFANVVYPEDIEDVEEMIASQVKTSGGYDCVNYRIITKNGNIKRIEDWGHLVHDDELGDLYYVYLNDMEFREKLLGFSSQKAPEIKDTPLDELTGLMTWKEFRKKAPADISRLMNNGKSPSCIYFNIRNFHTYNETYGFAGGDRMLKSIARILQDMFPGCLLSRIGDDHFVIITPNERLDDKINRLSMRVNNIRRDVIVEMKAGIYEIKDERMDISVICDCAKVACDSIKMDYGASYQLYDGKMDDKVHMQEHILSTFQDALDNGRIHVYLQPVVDVSTGRVASVEALTRWDDPKYGRLSPASFLYVLEEQHLIHKLDGYVISRVCEELRRKQDSGEELVPVSLNLSRLDFELTDIVRVIEDAVNANNIPRDMLRFELTESLIAVDMDAMKHESDRMREHGFKVWMDAFGSGYSSLKVLKDFTLDGLKIDMDMIRSVDDQRAHIIISAVIDMARRLGIPALSKGVETKEQLEFLKSAGCDLAQGYLFGRPEPMK